MTVALALAVLPARAAHAAVALETIVAKHLAWLQATDNYLAEIRTAGLQTGRLGIVFVDNTVKPAQVFFEGEVDFPNERKRTLEIAGTDLDARASVGDRAAAWTLPQTPFKGSFSIFERGLTVQQAIERLQQLSPKVDVVENPHGGLVGITISPAPDFLTRVDGMLESLLLGGSLPRGVTSTIWFNGDGRIERMVLTEDVHEALITRLTYLDTNLPATRSRKYRRSIDMRAKAQVYPTLLEMLLAIKQEDLASDQKGKP